MNMMYPMKFKPEEDYPITHDTPGAALRRKKFPTWSYCGRCGEPWAVSAMHITRYESDDEWEYGCSVLCEQCWHLLGSPEARIEYYGILLNWWWANGWIELDDLARTRTHLGKAVANGG